jgi:hypothetical protein
MNSKRQFVALEMMSRETASLAGKQMAYWLSEADEWKRLQGMSCPMHWNNSTRPDWCSDASNHRALTDRHGKTIAETSKLCEM